MANLEVAHGTFVLDATLTHGVADPDDTAIKHGADFSVQFIPKRDGKFGIIQLIRGLVDVGAFAQNKTQAGWAVDKQPDAGRGASNHCYALTYGITADSMRSNPHSWFGGGPNQAARTTDAPQELVALRGAGVGKSTKFVHYAVDVATNSVCDEGMIWSYDTYGNPATPQPRSVLLSKTSEHRDAMAKYLGNVSGGQNVQPNFRIV